MKPFVFMKKEPQKWRKPAAVGSPRAIALCPGKCGREGGPEVVGGPREHHHEVHVEPEAHDRAGHADAYPRHNCGPRRGPSSGTARHEQRAAPAAGVRVVYFAAPHAAPHLRPPDCPPLPETQLQQEHRRAREHDGHHIGDEERA